MKITDVKTYNVLDRSLFVKIDTDEGIWGFGECSPMAIRATAEMIHAAKSMLIGRDPFAIDAIWFDLFSGLYKSGNGGQPAYVISGIDIALYDLKGKALGVPAFELLGGIFRKDVELVAALWRLDETIEREVERVQEAVASGYRSVKLHMDKRWGFDAEPDRTIALMTSVRRAVGDDIRLLADMNNAYTFKTALRVGQAFAELGVVHFEEPLAAYNYDDLRELSTRLDIPVASGEQEYSRWQFDHLIRHGNPDIIMPDVIKTYGFSESRRIGDLALMHSKPVVCHNAYPTINTVAHLHYWASTKMCFLPQEYVVDPHPLRDEFPLFPNLPVPVDGRLSVPSGPGLGQDVDLQLLDKLAR